jgi:beta-glucosidase
VQVEYLKKLARAGAKIVLVLAAGSPLAVGEVADLVDAIVYVWYPGQEGGRALADILFGQVSPSGKLPLTFPRATADLPPFEDYHMARRTYRYATVEPLYPFGFGLSYTRFGYSGLLLKNAALQPGQALEVEVTVSNLGSTAGADIAQVYISYPQSVPQAPRFALAGFQRVELAPGEHRRLNFIIPAEALTLWDEQGSPLRLVGECMVTVGGSLPDERSLALGAPQPVSVVFSLF